VPRGAGTRWFAVIKAHLSLRCPLRKRPSAAPTGIDWTRLSVEDLEEMPMLAELKRMTTSNA
jgi:hypothetical protein